MTLDDLQKLAKQSGAVIVINNLTINDYSQHLTVETLRTAAPLLPLTPLEAERRQDQIIRERWMNDHESTGYL